MTLMGTAAPPPAARHASIAAFQWMPQWVVATIGKRGSRRRPELLTHPGVN